MAPDGGGGGTPGDRGGDGSTSSPDLVEESGHSEDGAPLTGIHAFEVSVQLTPSGPDPGPGPTAPPPGLHRIVLLLDADQRRLIAAAPGGITSVAVSTTDGRAFTISEPLRAAINTGFAVACMGYTDVEYQQLTIVVTGTGLTGSGAARAFRLVEDTSVGVSVSAVLTGTPDTTPPVLVLEPGSTPTNPLGVFSLTASKPLLKTARVRVTASDGTTAELEPRFSSDGMYAIGFEQPRGMLRFDETYTFAADSYLDLAGNAGVDPPLPAFKTIAVPPLLPEDGFESATGTSVAGASIIEGGAPLAIAGARSVIIGNRVSSPDLPQAAANVLLARLPIASGDRVVRFTYRVISTYQTVADYFPGIVTAGVPGVGATGLAPITSQTPGVAAVVLPSGGTLYLGATSTAEIPLPTTSGATEVAVQIGTRPPSCGLPPPPTSLIVDDLRVE